MSDTGRTAESVGARFNAEALACGIVEGDDFAADLGSLCDATRGPRHTQLASGATHRVLPVPRLSIETDHAGAGGILIAERSCDEETVVGVIVVHVVQHGGHYVVTESWHQTTLVDASVSKDGA